MHLLTRLADSTSVERVLCAIFSHGESEHARDIEVALSPLRV